MRLPILLVVMSLSALSFFNPTERDFRHFMTSNAEQIVLREAGHGTVGRLMSGLGGPLAADFIAQRTDRRSYVLFSTYRVKLSQGMRSDDDWWFIGIGGQFIELQRPRSLSQFGT
jgi:hypothetical protein